jgi:hypothetical protein
MFRYLAEERARDLLEGRLRLNKLSLFADPAAATQLNSAQADSSEGMGRYAITMATERDSKDLQRVGILVDPESCHGASFVNCRGLVRTASLYYSYSASLLLSADIMRRFEKSHCVRILNPPLFFSHVHRQLLKKGICEARVMWRWGPCSYLPDGDLPISDDRLHPTFRKPITHEWQREIRGVWPAATGAPPHIDLYIPQIRRLVQPARP